VAGHPAPRGYHSRFGGSGILAWGPLLLWTLGAALGALAVGHWIYRQLGGHTGDTYGATVEWSEAIALLWGSLIKLS
jgi:adenosylcobinamide-GDP ribazoletransferase